MPAALLLPLMPPRVEDLPRYARYQEKRDAYESMRPRSANVSVHNTADGRSVIVVQSGKRFVYDLKKRALEPYEGEIPVPRDATRGGRGQAPSRGRQAARVASPDGSLTAIARDANIYLKPKEGPERALTTDGSAAKRLKYGIASWVYGEELNVRDAMWFSPDGKRLAFYRFDESMVKDYVLSLGQNGFQTSPYLEAYPKAGTPNPAVTLMVADLGTNAIRPIQTNFGDAKLGEYVFDVAWSPDGKELLFNRTNRLQNHWQLCAADPLTGTARMVVEEKQPQSWADNSPLRMFLGDGRRFIHSSERNGFRGLYLYDLSGRELATLANPKADVIGAPIVDEASGVVMYQQAGAKNPYANEAYRVGIDGTKRARLTPEDGLDHRVSLYAGGRFIVDRRSGPNTPTQVWLKDIENGVERKIGEDAPREPKPTAAEPATRPRQLVFPAADGRTPLYGEAYFPLDYNPKDLKKKWPVVLDVYGGPDSGPAQSGYLRRRRECELGVIIVSVASRGTMNRGKAFRDAVYGKLGTVEIDDQAAWVRAFCQATPGADVTRVGVHGTSYGGYFTVMSMLRHPDLYKVGCASSSVTDWRHYDTIYTERYMGLPEAGQNLKGYDEGSSLRMADRLKGRLVLFYGTADDNVHPANTYTLISALEAAGKRYDLLAGPDRGHAQMPTSALWGTLGAYLDAR